MTNNTTTSWQQRILDCQNSGMSVKDWCRKNNIQVDSYYLHLKRLKSEPEENKIVPLSLPKPAPIHDERIRIDCGNIKIALPETVSPELLTAVLSALKSC